MESNKNNSEEKLGMDQSTNNTKDNLGNRTEPDKVKDHKTNTNIKEKNSESSERSSDSKKAANLKENNSNENSVKDESQKGNSETDSSSNNRNRSNYKRYNRNYRNRKPYNKTSHDESKKSTNENADFIQKIDEEIKETEKEIKSDKISESENKGKQQQISNNPETGERKQHQQKFETKNKPEVAAKPTHQQKFDKQDSDRKEVSKNETDNAEIKNRKNLHKNRRRNFKNPEKFTGFPKQRGTSFKKVSVIVPLLNEEDSLNILTNEIRKAIKKLNIDHEIIFINDGSTDNSLNVIKTLARNDKKIKYISFNKNYGKSAALQMGFKNATGDAVITMDADLQDDPAEIPNLIAKLEEGYDLVSGWKKTRHDPFVKKHSSKFFNFTTRIMSGIKIHDFNCGLKAYRNDVVKSVNIYGELHRYVPVLAGWNGYKITEIPVKHHSRRFGETKFGISRFFKGFIDLLTVTFTTRYIKRPMHLFGFLGAIAFLIGFIVNGYLTYEWLIGKTYIGNRPLLFLGILLIIVGVQFFSVGLLGELIVHNLQNDKEYVIKDSNV